MTSSFPSYSLTTLGLKKPGQVTGAAKEGRKALAQLLAKPSFHWRCMGLPALRIVIWLRNAAFETLR
jgi:hypothetical protein